MALTTTQTVEAEGVTKEEALREAFVRLGVPPEVLPEGPAEAIREAAILALKAEPGDLSIRVLSEGSKGLLGLGGKSALVRVTLVRRRQLEPEAILQTILDKMGVSARVRREDREGEIHLNIETEELAIVIGRHGKTLDALQYLVNSIVNRSALIQRRIVVNAGDYREKREDMLVEMAHQAARKVRATGRDVVLEPMSARDRRVIHLALRDDEDVRTFSRGEGSFRAVVVAPKDRSSRNNDR
ncbi:MAG: DNA-binding protein [Candidatus Poribacteria bacterium]|nr:MAG: DNA-binding protein [Candidatus Poribacteria bacterium]